MSMQPQVILLREGTDQSQGMGQIVSNINACEAIADAVRTTLGPRGLDKMITRNGQTTVSNDGATVLGLLDVVHPAARTLVDIARSQDAEVGDGTTSVTLLAGALLHEAKKFVEDGMHSTVLIRGFRRALAECVRTLEQIQVDVAGKSAEEQRDMLEKCAATALNSKLIAAQKEFFAKIVVDAVMALDMPQLDLANVGVKKVTGGSVDETQLVHGCAFKRTFAYAGFEQCPKKIPNAKVLCLNLELELKAERDNAELRIDDPAKYQEFVDAEWKIIYDKLAAIVETGANVVLSRLAIGDLATQYFADRQVFCAGRVPDDDLKRVCRATGAMVQTTVNGLAAAAAKDAETAAAKEDAAATAASAASSAAAADGPSVAELKPILGECELFEEKQVGAERFNFFTGCKGTATTTILLRGGGEAFIDEAERSMHDAIMIARRARLHQQIVAGGGATEMILAGRLRKLSKSIFGKEQLIIASVARALEVVPRQLSDNAGFDPTDIMNALRAAHYTEAATAEGAAPNWIGVDVDDGGVVDTFERFVWEPVLVKKNAITAATEAACVILSIDETIKDEDDSGGFDPGAVGQAAGAMGRAPPGMPPGMAGMGM